MGMFAVVWILIVGLDGIMGIREAEHKTFSHFLSVWVIIWFDS